MRRRMIWLFMTGWCSFISAHAFTQARILDSLMHHIRNHGSREWSEFAEHAEATRLQVSFTAMPNTSVHTLCLRQYDVKLDWKVTLNGNALGALVQDEKDLLRYFDIPPGILQHTNNLEIYTSETETDDIKVGEVTLFSISQLELLTRVSIGIDVLDAESGEHLPARITIINSKGTLQPVTVQTESPFAVRPGYVYTANGKLTIGLPAGTYTLFASRGFEYGVAADTLTVRHGEQHSRSFHIRREVNTDGWVGTDTHIHTATWSRHGDATSEERVITIAGEGIELPIITDHNLHVDLEPVASNHKLNQYFTVVTGNEITTWVGHFNIFPARGEPMSHKVGTWRALSHQIPSTTSHAVILNHGRDIHHGFRPLDPTRHLAIAGLRLDGWKFPANAMEVINSGSQQSDQMQLTHDWFGLLNGGHSVTPVGASDSHDVTRFIVGQARTYIRCNDDSIDNINIAEAVKNFVDGNVTVSFGLMTHIEVNDTYGPGELVPGSDEVVVTVEVSGPRWALAEKVTLYANGTKIREADITDEGKAGIKWKEKWNLTMPSHDIFLVAIAEGPGNYLPFWPIAKPFQPTSIEWHPQIFGISGAVWLDGDHNNRRNSARHYATRQIHRAGRDMTALVESLSAFHQSVAVQAAALLHQSGKNLKAPDVVQALQRGSGETRAAFDAVIKSLPSSTK